MSSDVEIETITCVSLQQPFADDVFFAGKWPENRSWLTAYRGEIWIHSSRIATGIVEDYKADGIDLTKASPTGMAVGCILGRANLFECIERKELLAIAPKEYLDAVMEKRPATISAKAKRVQMLLEHVDPRTWDHLADAKYAWIFAEPQMLDVPIPAMGKLRLWGHQVETERLVIADGRKRSWKTK